MKNSRSDRQITITLDPGLREKLEYFARLEQRTLSNMARVILEDYVRSEQERDTVAR